MDILVRYFKQSFIRNLLLLLLRVLLTLYDKNVIKIIVRVKTNENFDRVYAY